MAGAILAAAIVLIASGCAVRIPPPTPGIPAVANLTSCQDIAVGEGAVWATVLTYAGTGAIFVPSPGPRGYHLVKIDPETGRILSVLSLGTTRYSLTGLAGGLGAVWVAREGFPGTIHKIDPMANQVVADVEVDPGRFFHRRRPSIAVGEGAVWVTPGGDQLFKLDPGTGQITARVRLSEYVGGVKVGAGSVWLRTTRGLLRVDPQTNSMTASTPVNWQSVLTSSYMVSASTLWVSFGSLNSDLKKNQVNKIDLKTGEVVGVTLMDAPETAPRDRAYLPKVLAAGEKSVLVWLLRRGEERIAEIDPATNLVRREFAVGSEVEWSQSPTSGDDLWLCVGGRVRRVQALSRDRE